MCDRIRSVVVAEFEFARIRLRWPTFSALQPFRHIFSDQVDLEVDRIAAILETECGDGQRVRYQGHTEAGVDHAHERQTDPVHSYRAFANHVPTQLRGTRKPDHLPLALPLAPIHVADAVAMSLDDVAAQAITEPQGA